MGVDNPNRFGEEYADPPAASTQLHGVPVDPTGFPAPGPVEDFQADDFDDSFWELPARWLGGAAGAALNAAGGARGAALHAARSVADYLFEPEYHPGRPPTHFGITSHRGPRPSRASRRGKPFTYPSGRGQTITRMPNRLRRRRRSRYPWRRRRKRRRRYKRRRRSRMPSKRWLRRVAPRMVAAMNRPDYWFQHKAGQVTCAVNECEWALFTLNHATDLLAALATVSSNDTAQAFISRPRYRVQMRNNSSVPLWYKIFWLRPRRSLTSAEMPTSSNLLNDVDADYSGVTDLETNLFFSPFQSLELCKSFKIKAGKPRVLVPGQENVFTIRTRGFKISETELNRVSYSATRKSKIALVKVWGPVGVENALPSNVGTASIRLDYYGTVSYQISWTSNIDHSITEATSGLAALSGGWKGIGSSDITSIAETVAS